MSVDPDLTALLREIETHANPQGRGPRCLRSTDVPPTEREVREAFTQVEEMGPVDYAEKVPFALSLLAFAPDVARTDLGLSYFLAKPRNEYLLRTPGPVTLMDELEADALEDLHWTAPCLVALDVQTLTAVVSATDDIVDRLHGTGWETDLTEELTEFVRFVRFAADAGSK